MMGHIMFEVSDETNITLSSILTFAVIVFAGSSPQMAFSFWLVGACIEFSKRDQIKMLGWDLCRSAVWWLILINNIGRKKS